MAVATRKKKVLTAEQEAAKVARAERFKALTEAVSKMTESQKQELVARVGGILSASGKSLSLYNSCLVISQLPHAVQVGGFRQWNALGRKVKKGECGIQIYIPVGGSEQAEGENGEGETSGRVGFILGYVWDISQTELIGGEIESE